VSKAHTYTLIFENGLVSPDNFKQSAILINGRFPGPEIRVKQSEVLIVNVVNKLDHGFSIHFHGILQRGSVSSDGVPGVTQQEIPPNGTYRYIMSIGHQSGTYIYHAHTGMDQNWAMGPLIIEESRLMFSTRTLSHEYFYHYEYIFLLSQSWHVPLSDIEAGVLGSPFEDIPDTDTLLINGRSYGGRGYQIINVRRNMIYRFRVIGMGMDSMLSFRVANHSMKVIEADGILVNPVKTDHLELNSAQRYSVLIKMDQPIDNYWIQTEAVPGPGPGNGFALLCYEGAPRLPHLRNLNPQKQTPELELTEWILPQLTPNPNIIQPVVYRVPEEYDREIVIRSFQRNINGFTKFDINGNIFTGYKTPIFHQIRNGVNFSNAEPQVFELIVGEKIQMVFENRFSDDQECEQHPWHLHGHTVHVVGNGPDEYNPVTARRIIERNVLENRNQFRDVVTLFPNRSDEKNSSGTACGWTAIRFVVDNPGVWLVHCHLTAHMLMGKMFVLYEHEEHDSLLALS
jgi:L-ascorbate oxidase